MTVWAMGIDQRVLDLIYAVTLKYSIKYGGKTSPKFIIGKVIAIKPDIKKNLRDIIPEINKIVEKVNNMTLEEQKAEFEKYKDILPEEVKKEEKKVLPPLKGAEEGKVRMRFAPGPSGPLHIGHSRAVILNDEYVKMYKGVFILRLEDTNPRNVLPEAYDMIKEDVEWLDAKWHEFYIQSDRMEIYYEHAKKLLEMGKAYICTEDPETWRKKKVHGEKIPERDLPPEVQLEKWEKMLEGEYDEGEAVFVVKTDLNHPNPAVRDFVGFRIIKDIPHPRTGEKYIVYPTYNFAVAIDDHLMGVTHVLRGKDHLVNTMRQEYIYEHFGWKKPFFYHYGLVSMEDVILKTTTIKEGIKKGEYIGWDDPRLGTLRALAKRGIKPEAIRKYWLDVGLKEVDIKFSWDILYSYNRELIDRDANRYFFVWDPVEVEIKGLGTYEAKIPKHPNDPSRGFREHRVSLPTKVYLAKSDWERISEGETFRLKDLFNVTRRGDILEFAGNDLAILKKGAKILHWLLEGLPMTVIKPNGEKYEGIVEKYIEESLGNVVQLERFGYCRVEKGKDGRIIGFYTHP